MTEGPPINLEYRTPDPRGPRRAGPAYLLSRLISSYIGYLLVMAVLVLIVPRFEQVFADFKLAVPTATSLLLSISRICVRNYLWISFLPLPAIWAYGCYCISNRRLRRGLRLTAFLLVVAFLVVTLLSLFIPTFSLLHGVAGKH